MSEVAQMSPIELDGFVCAHLSGHGIEVVLSGGACVAHYSRGRYVSMDLDFVNAGFAKRRAIKAAMAEIGFNEENRYFKHLDCDYVVEFPPGPLGVGDEPVSEILDLETPSGVVRIISPIDCVKDRLASYYHWDDMQCLEQALCVAREHEVDLEELGRWSQREGKSNAFAAIRERLGEEHQPD